MLYVVIRTGSFNLEDWREIWDQNQVSSKLELSLSFRDGQDPKEGTQGLTIMLLSTIMYEPILICEHLLAK